MCGGITTLIYSLRRTNWWVAQTDSLVLIDPCFDSGASVPDLACRLRLGAGPRLYNCLVHEYSIRAPTVLHFQFTVTVLTRVCVCVFGLQCKLEQQACLTGKDLTLRCAGLCPCTTAAPTPKENKRGRSKRLCCDTEYSM